MNGHKVWMKAITGICLCTALFIASQNGWAQSKVADLQPFISNVEQSQQGMSLWELVKTGGFIMIILGLLSIVAVALIVYDFMTLKTGKLVPAKFTEEIIQKLELRDDAAVQILCQDDKYIMAKIVSVGLDKRSKGRIIAREAMETMARKEIGKLWQNISYLSDIASVAPLIGLLGTVLGMIQAFNVIAFQTAVVKPILLAGGVSKAMVTTAGGLIVAIPVILFYSYFRGQVQEIASIVEADSADIIKVIEET